MQILSCRPFPMSFLKTTFIINVARHGTIQGSQLVSQPGLGTGQGLKSFEVANHCSEASLVLLKSG